MDDVVAVAVGADAGRMTTGGSAAAGATVSGATEYSASNTQLAAPATTPRTLTSSHRQIGDDVPSFEVRR